MNNNGLGKIFLLVLTTILFVVFIVVLDKNNNNIKENNKNKKIVDKTHKVYKSEDKVLLKDNTEWYVLYDTKNTEKNVTILSKDNINNNNYSNVEINKYLKNEYIDLLMSRLSVNRSEIVNVRMLNINDISNVLGVDNKKLLKKYNIKEKEIFKDDTLIDYFKDDNYYSICEENICNSDNRNLRVVLTINKYFVNKTS